MFGFPGDHVPFFCNQSSYVYTSHMHTQYTVYQTYSTNICCYWFQLLVLNKHLFPTNYCRPVGCTFLSNMLCFQFIYPKCMLLNYLAILNHFMCIFRGALVQMMTYLCLAATASATQGSLFAKLGEPALQWMKICNMYGKFCNQIGEGIASAVLVSLSMVILSAISAFSLFRLYGENKAKSNARWQNCGSLAGNC